MKMKYTNPKKKVVFDSNVYEELENELFNGIGNLDRYLTACKLKESEIEGCVEISDYASLIEKCCNIGSSQE